METLSFIVERVFKQRDMNQLEGDNVLHILQKYSEALYKHYVSIRFENLTVGDIPLIEFVCIRIIYLSLGLDEISTNNTLWHMPHSAINTYVPKTWPSKRTIELEMEILAICDWNPLRFCKLLCDDMETGLPLWDSPIMHENLTETLPKPISSQANDAVLSIL
jgi:hypothetical protein